MWYYTGSGRRRKYETAEALQEAVDKYFDSITYEKIVKEEGEVVYNAAGEPVKRIAFAVPPTNESLCLFIGISRMLWCTYRRDDELGPVCHEADLKIRAWRTEEVSTRDRTQGLQFLLSNDSGMADMNVNVNTASMSDRKNILAKLAEMQEDFK